MGNSPINVKVTDIKMNSELEENSVGHTHITILDKSVYFS